MKRKKPRLGFWQIWNMSFGFFGIQFGFALQNANVSRIFQTLGADIGNLSILWVAAPVTGLLVQPVVGHYSDKTWNRFGRRRPYFMAGALLASLALILMPNSPSLWFAAGMLWILDASINISMEPFRAFVGDMLPAEQRTKGFAMQSFFIGTGAVIASTLPWIMTNWLKIDNTAPPGVIPPSVKWAFYTGGIVFFAAVMWTVFTTKEYSPEEMASFEEENIAPQSGLQADRDGMYYKNKGGKQIFSGGIWFIAGVALSLILYFTGLNKNLYVLSFGFMVLGVLLVISGLLQANNKHHYALVEIMNDMFSMPKTMLQLALVQFFSWFALFAMWIYTTPAVTQNVFNTTDTSSQAYNDGADWVSILFAVYNGVAAIAAWLLTPMSKLTNRKTTHAVSLILGGAGLFSVFFIRDQYLLLISMIGVGIAWASILSIPYAILTNALPQNKLGVYMGIFNYFIVIPQIVAAAILGFILDVFFDGTAVFALVIGGISMLLASILVWFINDKSK